FAALRNLQRLSGRIQITQLFSGLLIDDRRAHRHIDEKVLAATPGAVIARTALTVACAKGALDAEIRQRIDAVLRVQPDTAAHAAVTTIRPAEGDELLAAETDAAAAAIAGLHLDCGFVDEFHCCRLQRREPRREAGVLDDRVRCGTGFSWPAPRSRRCGVPDPSSGTSPCR